MSILGDRPSRTQRRGWRPFFYPHVEEGHEGPWSVHHPGLEADGPEDKFGQPDAGKDFPQTLDEEQACEPSSSFLFGSQPAATREGGCPSVDVLARALANFCLKFSPSSHQWVAVDSSLQVSDGKQLVYQSHLIRRRS